MLSQMCKKCNIPKPIEDFPFSPSKKKHGINLIIFNTEQEVFSIIED